jgi:hypothetical protein
LKRIDAELADGLSRTRQRKSPRKRYWKVPTAQDGCLTTGSENERNEKWKIRRKSHRNGKEQRGVIEVIRQIPERTVAWRTIGDGVGLRVVSFEPLSDDATEVTLKLRSVFNPSISGQSADEYLLNFKQLIEQKL